MTPERKEEIKRNYAETKSAIGNHIIPGHIKRLVVNTGELLSALEEAQKKIYRLQAEKDTQSGTIRRQQGTIDEQNAAWETDQQTIARQREALKFYADSNNWWMDAPGFIDLSIAEKDSGSLAIAALGEGAKES